MNYVDTLVTEIKHYHVQSKVNDSRIDELLFELGNLDPNRFEQVLEEINE